ncbi:MAG: hypothetical protein ABIH89_04195 [Elusimicrobiota bacterium]
MSLKAREILANKRLGEILKSLDLIDDKKLSEILEKQKTSKMRLGDILSSMGYVDQEIILSLVGKQLGYSYLRISEYGKIPADIIQYVPANIARQHMLIPFEKKNEVLKVAMSEPQDEDIRAALSLLTGLNVEAYITSKEEVIKAIEKSY